MPRPASAASSGYGAYQFNWSDGEKKVARRAFERALKEEFKELVAETKRRANQIKEVDEVWDLAGYIAGRRREIDERYDYRYSILPIVLAALIKAGRLSERDLAGLREDKLEEIRGLAKLRL